MAEEYMQKRCLLCHKPFVTKSKRRKFCSPQHRRQWHFVKYCLKFGTEGLADGLKSYFEHLLKTVHRLRLENAAKQAALLATEKEEEETEKLLQRAIQRLLQRKHSPQ